MTTTGWSVFEFFFFFFFNTVNCGTLEMLHWWESPIVIEMLNVGFDTNTLS